MKAESERSTSAGERGARIWPDGDPAAICLRNDADETARGLRDPSRRHSNRSERQAPDRGGHRKRAPVGRGDGSQLRRRLAARAIRRHVSGAKQHAGADRRRTREDHGLGRFGLEPWAGEIPSRLAAELHPGRRLQARTAPRRLALDLEARRAFDVERERQGLQSALRRRQADRPIAAADLRDQRRGGSARIGDERDRSGFRRESDDGCREADRRLRQFQAGGWWLGSLAARQFSAGLGNADSPAAPADGGAIRERAAAQFGGVPVAALNSELGALGPGRISAGRNCPMSGSRPICSTMRS